MTATIIVMAAAAMGYLLALALGRRYVLSRVYRDPGSARISWRSWILFDFFFPYSIGWLVFREVMLVGAETRPRSMWS